MKRSQKSWAFTFMIHIRTSMYYVYAFQILCYARKKLKIYPMWSLILSYRSILKTRLFAAFTFYDVLLLSCICCISPHLFFYTLLQSIERKVNRYFNLDVFFFLVLYICIYSLLNITQLLSFVYTYDYKIGIIILV